ncbi:hypothetical protein [Psychrobacter urativorans]|uniref:hypothetical protein n=1 Tax=Psychrobacter urativorans TaxID=45610 RepID=UPI001917DCD9|nr:hypothetical protein [Psychrobacter urativorans]
MLIMAGALTLSACQTLSVSSSEPNSVSKSSDNYKSESYGNQNIITLVPDVPDSDGDGVLDDVDACPGTPLHTVVDNTGCTIVVDVGGLEMEFHGFFPPMSSQLPPIYHLEFAKIEEKLNEYPDATVFIFGHVASNETNKDSLATFGFESLPRNRALIVKNMLVLEHNIASERIHTYDCSNNILLWIQTL